MEVVPQNGQMDSLILFTLIGFSNINCYKLSICPFWGTPSIFKEPPFKLVSKDKTTLRHAAL
jgi:hypothetical protein